MRTFEFTCKNCGKTVRESAGSQPEVCRSCAAAAEREVAKGKLRGNKAAFRAVPLGTPMPGESTRRLTSDAKSRPPCKYCRGTGKIQDSPCRVCQGTGYQKEK